MWASSTVERHRRESPRKLNFAIILCSTSRYESLRAGKPIQDESMSLAKELIERAKHQVVSSRILPDDAHAIRQELRCLLSRDDVDVILTIGGTGVAPADVTVEAALPMLEKTMPGFGELLRTLSYQVIGSAAIMTRSVAGIARGKAVFCLPGSPQAVKLALEEIVLRESPHVVLHAREKISLSWG